MRTQPKKLPYGQSNFARLIEKNYAYVDKTRYIELLENENNTYQFLLRPRRFGKSLFLSVLENYYDINKKSKFESLFGNLYIGKNTTAEQGSYTVLSFDFSGLDTESHETFRKSFSNAVQEQVICFLERYKSIFSSTERAMEKGLGIDALSIAYTAARNANVPIFVLIDEYDHFANNLIAMGESYIGEVKAGGLVRSFYEALKAGTKSVVGRFFITGVSPMMLNDLTSGFNMATDYTLFPKYNEMFGFTREDVERLMAETGVDKDLIKVDMETYYNGYMFSRRGKDKVYNSQMILYLFNMVLQLGMQPDHIVDANLRTDYGRLRRLARNENNKENLLKIIIDGKVEGSVIEKFSVYDLQNEEYFVSLLFYLGMLTFGETMNDQACLKIPNYSIRTLYWEYMAEYLKNIEEDAIDTGMLSETIRNMAYDGSIKPFLDYFTESFLKRLSNRDLQKFDEKYIKAMMLTLLYVNNLYLPVSEDETVNGYTDIYLQKHPAKSGIKYEYVFEIKYAKTSASEAGIVSKIAEAKAQLSKYKMDSRFANQNNIKFAALLFTGKGDCEVACEM